MITCSHNEIIQEYKFKEIQNMIIRIKKKKRNKLLANNGRIESNFWLMANLEMVDL